MSEPNPLKAWQDALKDDGPSWEGFPYRSYGATISVSAEDIRNARPDELRVYELIKEDYQNGIDACHRFLAEAMFKAERPMFASFITPEPWWSRWGWRVRGYVVNLWDAVLGRTPEPDDDYDY